jgi:maltooligosyltrehalose trehalohydrolase
VRRFFIENAWHWLEEYGIDGLRLDATHAIIDTSPRHFLPELSETLRDGLGRTVYLIAETHENDPNYMRPVPDGGFGFDAVWADDFHHACRTAVAGDHEGYYAAFRGLPDLRRIVERGWLFEGQADPSADEPRGQPAEFDRWGSVVFCIQNHDQVGNRAFGERLTRTASASSVRALTALLLLHPATPLLFQGQEFHSARPFLFFTDHNADLAEAVREGRRAEFAKFSAFQSEDLREAIPDPQEPSTFEWSKLERPCERDAWSGLVEAFYAELTQVRRGDPVLAEFRRKRLPIVAEEHGECLAVRFACATGTRVLVANLGRGEGRVAVADVSRVIVNSDEARFGGYGRRVTFDGDVVVVPGETSVFLA